MVLSSQLFLGRLARIRVCVAVVRPDQYQLGIWRIRFWYMVHRNHQGGGRALESVLRLLALTPFWVNLHGIFLFALRSSDRRSLRAAIGSDFSFWCNRGIHNIAGWLLMALSHMRQAILVSLVVPPLIAVPLGRQFGRLKSTRVTRAHCRGGQRGHGGDHAHAP